MIYDDRVVIENGSHVTIRRVSSIASSGNTVDRSYESDVIEVYDTDLMKMSLPREYGETVTLSLDGIYEITIRTEDAIYRGRGRILERFRDVDGNVCVFRLTDNLAKDDNKKYLTTVSNMVGEYTLLESEEGGQTTITEISMDYLIMQGDQYIPDDSEISVSFLLDGSREIRSRGTVGETIRLRSGHYESSVNLHDMSLPVQQELALWLLRQTS